VGLVGILLGFAAIVMVSIVGAILALRAVIVRSDVTNLRQRCDRFDAVAPLYSVRLNGSSRQHLGRANAEQC
jgi:hypothetical protein